MFYSESIKQVTLEFLYFPSFPSMTLKELEEIIVPHQAKPHGCVNTEDRASGTRD